MTAYDAYVEGRFLLESQRFDEALKVLTESHQELPHFKTALYLSECCRAMGLNTERSFYLKCAYELHPKSNEAATRYAEDLLKTGFTSAGMNVLKSVLSRSPEYGPARKLVLTVSPQ